MQGTSRGFAALSLSLVLAACNDPDPDTDPDAGGGTTSRAGSNSSGAGAGGRASGGGSSPGGTSALAGGGSGGGATMPDGSMETSPDGGTCEEVTRSVAFRTPSPYAFEPDPVVLVSLDAVRDGCPATMADVPPLEPFDQDLVSCSFNQTATGCGVFTFRREGGHQDCHYDTASGDLVAATYAFDAFAEVAGCSGAYFHGGVLFEDACTDIDVECPEGIDGGLPCDGGACGG